MASGKENHKRGLVSAARADASSLLPIPIEPKAPPLKSLKDRAPQVHDLNMDWTYGSSMELWTGDDLGEGKRAGRPSLRITGAAFQLPILYDIRKVRNSEAVSKGALQRTRYVLDSSCRAFEFQSCGNHIFPTSACTLALSIRPVRFRPRERQPGTSQESRSIRPRLTDQTIRPDPPIPPGRAESSRRRGCGRQCESAGTNASLGVPSPVTSSQPGAVCRLSVWFMVRSV